MNALRIALCYLLLLIAAAPVLAQSTSPVPFVDLPLVPSTAAPGGLGFNLTVNGAGFTAASVVNWNGSPRATTFVSATQLTAVISASDIVVGSTASVTVVNPVPGGGTSKAVPFAVSTPTTGPFYLPTSFAGDPYPNHPITLDVNQDGKLDVISVDPYGAHLNVNLGNGDGTFQTAQSYSIESQPLVPASGDFNRDGKMDLAIANTNGTVSVLLGNGDGTFQTHIDYPTGGASSDVVVGDFNRDGNLDLAIANNTPSGGVSVLLGTGNGFFQPQVVYPAGPTPQAVAISDFNRDGNLDLVVADDAAVSVLLGNGDGTFQRATVYELNNNSQAWSVVAADFDGDGAVDVIVGCANARVYELLGNNDGTLRQPRSKPSVYSAYQIADGDLNGDGFLDILVSSTSNGAQSFEYLAGNGNGTFQNAKNVLAHTSPVEMSIGDFNNDGYADVVVGSGALIQTTANASPISLGFGKVFIGQVSSAKIVTLHNYAGLPLTLSGISISSSNFTETDNCGTSVAAYGTCTINVVFAPLQAGSLSGTLTISDDAYGSPQGVALSGTGVQPPQPAVTLSPTSLTFAAQKVGTSSSPQNITLTNSGTATLNLTSISAGGDFTQINTCGSSLRQGQNCTIIVTFTPTQVGTRTGAVTISDNAPDTPQMVPLTGTGTP